MEISYLVSAIVACTFWGISEYFRAKKKWYGTAVLQSEAKDGAYRVLAKTKRYTKIIIIAERSDGEICCLLLKSDLEVNIFRIMDGHVLPFN